MSTSPTPPDSAGFSTDQKEYLQGFMAGVVASGQFPFAGHAADGRITATAAEATPVEPTVHGTPLADLCKEERWKHDENPLDAWERLVKHADADQLPDPENTYRFKTHGLFYVAPAQDSFMIRLRIPAGELSAHQMHGLADIAADIGGGYAHVTTRANIQIREFKPRDLVTLLTRVQDLGLTSRGAGADNIRNVTASPHAGFDPDELIDTRPFAKALHHYILNHRDLYGLPRKFNVSFDGGGSISAAADTNDIGFFAVRVTDESLAKANLRPADLGPSPALPGIYFRVMLGGISGHGDFARDTGLLIKPSEAVAVAAAMIRVFAENGDRTNRKKARLKYLLEKWGFEKFIDESAKRLAFPLGRLPLENCQPRRPVRKHAWLGVNKQSQRGLYSIGIGVPVGRLSPKQMHALADLAANFGTGELRLSAWQNVIIPHIPEAFVNTVERSIHRLGFTTEPNLLTGGIIACTGSRGCKYAAADTKAHAVALIKHLGKRPETDCAFNIHFTGCPHSCAQHYCGDIGFVGAKLQDGSEGYHLVVGGGMDDEQGIGRELFRGVRAEEVNTTVTRLIDTFEQKRSLGETFVQWTRRHSLKELQEMLST
ncbi:MAG: NirA family protein [Verrucomicrobiota bacterium]